MKIENVPKKMAVVFGVNGQRQDLLADAAPGEPNASYNAGFPPITMIAKSAGGKAPLGKDFNQIFNELSADAQWNQASGIYPYDADFSKAIGGYPKGAIVLGSDGLTIYQSKIDDNKLDTNDVSWQEVISSSKLSSSAGMSLIGSYDSCEDLELATLNSGSYIIVKSRNKGWSAVNSAPSGGGIFIIKEGEYKEDGGIIFKTARDGFFAVRVFDGPIQAEFYGAVGDGVSDDSHAINLALSNAISHGRGVVELLSKVYAVSSNILVPSSTTLRGQGMGATKILALDDMNPAYNVIVNAKQAFGLPAGTDYDENIVLEDFSVNGNAYKRNPSNTWFDFTNTANNIHFRTVRDSYISRVETYNGVQHCLNISSGEDQDTSTIDVDKTLTGMSYNISVRDVVAYNAQLDDCITTHASRGVSIIRCRTWKDNYTEKALGSNQNGIEIDDGSFDIYVSECYAEGFSSGFQAKGHSNVTPARGVTFNKCYARGNAVSFQLQHRNYEYNSDGLKHTAVGFHLIDCTSDGTSSTIMTGVGARDILITLGVRDVKITNFTIVAGDGNIYLDRSVTDVHINGLYVKGCPNKSFADNSSFGLIQLNKYAQTVEQCVYTVKNVFCDTPIKMPVVNDNANISNTGATTSYIIENITASAVDLGLSTTLPLLKVPLHNASNIRALNPGVNFISIRDTTNAAGGRQISDPVTVIDGLMKRQGTSSNPNDDHVSSTIGSTYINTTTGDMWICTVAGGYSGWKLVSSTTPSTTPSTT